MIKLSRHFIENWQARVSPVRPDMSTVLAALDGSIRLQRGNRFVLANGKIIKTLTLFWNPDLSIVISMDPVTHVAVTVSSGVMRDRDIAAPAGKKHNYVEMTAHGLSPRIGG